MMARSDFCIGDLESGYKLVALERQIHDRDTNRLVAVQIMITQNRSSYMVFKGPQMLTQSRIIILNKDMTLRQVKKRIFKLFRPIVMSNRGVNVPERGSHNYNEESIIEAEYKAYFEENNMGYDREGIGNDLYKLQVFNNTAVEPGMFFNYRKKCELCDREHKDNCDFATTDEKSKLVHLTT